MEVAEQIKKFTDFIGEKYKDQLLKRIRKDERFIVLDFSELVSHDSALAEVLLDQPEEVVKAAEIAVEQFDTLGDVSKFKVRFTNLLPSQKIMIRNIRSEHIDKLMLIEGTVRQKSDVRPQVVAAKFECPSCGNILNVLQIESKFKEPSRCGCGRKGRFKLLDKEMVDAQGIVLEEASEDLEGGEQPKRINLLLKNDLVSPISEKKTNPGSKIRITGILKEVPIIGRDGGKLTRFDLMIEVNCTESIEEDFSSLEITSEVEEEILALSKDPKLHEKLINSVVPSIYGYERIKEAVLFQMAGGVRKIRDDGAVSRGDIHVLLVGDPGAGKSQILKRIARIAPKGRFVSGKGASGALTAAVVKDEFLSGWSLEAGALVLANRGVCCIDELDKMNNDDRDAMHEALEGQTVTISKANIQATLRSETTVLAAANPKFGRFDPYEIIPKQIELPSTLINRFDLIFPVRDIPNKEKDEKLSSFVLNLHQSPEMIVPPIDSMLLRKYFAYARQNIFPELTDQAVEEIKGYYLKMRGSGSDEGEIKAIPISARQLEALLRMSEASARLRLGKKVTRKDAKKAVELMHFCLSQVGLDPETGAIDIDRISTGITASERSHISTVKEIINELEKKVGRTIPMDDIVELAKQKGIDEEGIEESIQKLKRAGDIFEPTRGKISKI